MIKLEESTVNFQGVPVIFKDLFGNSTDSCKNLTSDDLGTMLNIYDSKKLMDENVYKDLSDKNIIQNDHEPSKTAKILDKYKNTTVRQPSLNVSTKVELKAPFFIGRRVYQRLKGHNRNVFTFSELTRAKIMLLSDSAGNGKSTTFRRAAWKLKRTLPLHWISYVDLKEHVEALIEVNLNNTNASAIIDFLIDYIMQLKSEVDREIFNQKFLADNVIILWDGVDEISPICTEKILGLIDKISKLTNNSQWISTRVHLESIIAKRFNVYPYGLYYYNEAEKLNFIRKSLDIHKIVNETALIIEDRINSTILRLESPGISRNIQNKEIKTPLMIKMICDYQLDIFKEEDRNKTISSSSNILNIYRIYAYLVKKHFDIAYDNKSQIVKEDVEKIQEDQIFIDLFTKLELCDMIMELIESLQIFAINFEEHGKNESLVSTKRKDFLEFIFEGEPKRLEYIYSRIIDIYIR
ncbi:unnamed protein product [Chironomus riparius]|uniref:NACHT domain-containing protein n=1 Tax=Chironomus riparius TaxID=315576 RepID=A0A9N9S9Z5_9DIPT|nr:unnamed protein product [Chironomus riparius]